MAEGAGAAEQPGTEPDRAKGFKRRGWFQEKDDHKECLRQVAKAKTCECPELWTHCVCPRLCSTLESCFCDRLMSTVPQVQQMVKFIRELGCPIDLDEIVSCEPCKMAATGGFIHNEHNLPEGQYKPKVSNACKIGRLPVPHND